MRSILSLRLSILALSLGLSAHAAGLPSGLTGNDISTVTSILGPGTSHRSWTAHAVRAGGLGLDLGMESAVMLRGGLDELGIANAGPPAMIPVPRLWFAWELPADFMMSGSLTPGSAWGGVTALGAAAQWAFYRYVEWGMAVSSVVDFTYANAFGDFFGNTLGVSGQVSRDLNFWQPYFGAGFTLSFGSVRDSLATSRSANGATVLQPHFYAGARIDLLAKLGVQFDMFGSKPGFALMMSGHF